ncbi:MAG: APC family permease, partial [Gammaproteobacteria bacterium]
MLKTVPKMNPHSTPSDLARTASSSLNPETEQPRLRRSLGLGLLLFYGLGNIIGAGIYVLIGEVAANAGSAAPLAFLLSSIPAALTALTYTELAARLPYSAGEAVYAHSAFRSAMLSRLVGLIIALAGMLSAAAIARGFAGYLGVIIHISDAVAISALIGVLTLIAIWGIRQSMWLAAALTLIELIGLLLVIGGGIIHLGDTNQIVPTAATHSITTPSDSVSVWTWSGVFAGAFLAFYAFLGFEDMVNVAEEVERPERNLPIAILLALIISSLMYAGVSWIGLQLATAAELAASEAPLALLITRATALPGETLALIALLAVSNGVLAQIIMASRIVYGMAAQGWMPRIFMRVELRTQTPMLATILVAAVVLLLALTQPIAGLANATSALILIIFTGMHVALMVLQRRPGPKPAWHIPRWIPPIGIVVNLAF